MIRVLKIIALCVLLGAVPAHATSTPAKTTPAKTAAAKPAQARPYIEVDFDKPNKDASAIAKKVLAEDIRFMKEFDSSEPNVQGVFISIRPDQPNGAIAVMFTHPSVCGSSGCETIVIEKTGKNNTWREVFRTTLGRLFISQRPGKVYNDLLAIVMPRASDGFGVWFWNQDKSQYTFAGVSKFSK